MEFYTSDFKLKKNSPQADVLNNLCYSRHFLEEIKPFVTKVKNLYM